MACACVCVSVCMCVCVWMCVLCRVWPPPVTLQSVTHCNFKCKEKDEGEEEEEREKRRGKKFMPHPNGLLGNYTSELREGEASKCNLFPRLRELRLQQTHTHTHIRIHYWCNLKLEEVTLVITQHAIDTGWKRNDQHQHQDSLTNGITQTPDLKEGLFIPFSFFCSDAVFFILSLSLSLSHHRTRNWPTLLCMLQPEWRLLSHLAMSHQKESERERGKKGKEIKKNVTSLPTLLVTDISSRGIFNGIISSPSPFLLLPLSLSLSLSLPVTHSLVKTALT